MCGWIQCSGNEENHQSSELLLEQQFGGGSGRSMLPQSLLLAQSSASQPLMFAHHPALQEQALPPSFFTSHTGLVGHPGFNRFTGLPGPSGLAMFPGMPADQGLSQFPGLHEYQSGMFAQQHAMEMQQESEQMMAAVSQAATDSPHSEWQNYQLKQQQQHQQQQQHADSPIRYSLLLIFVMF